jgi:hypothetical protein
LASRNQQFHPANLNRWGGYISDLTSVKKPLKKKFKDQIGKVVVRDHPPFPLPIAEH